MTIALTGSSICLNILEKSCGACQMLLKYVVVDNYCFDLLRTLVFLKFLVWIIEQSFTYASYIKLIFFAAKREY